MKTQTPTTQQFIDVERATAIAAGYGLELQHTPDEGGDTRYDLWRLVIESPWAHVAVEYLHFDAPEWRIDMGIPMEREPAQSPDARRLSWALAAAANLCDALNDPEFVIPDRLSEAEIPAMPAPVVACDIYDWCDGSDHTEPAHTGSLDTARAGESEVEVTIYSDPQGTSFILDLCDWNIDSNEIDAEFRDLRSIVDQLEETVRAVKL